MDEHALIQARQEIDEIDEEMAQLFVRRMQAVSRIASYKQAHGLPIFDEAREKEVIARNTARMGDETLRPFYLQYISEVMRVSRCYQERLSDGVKDSSCDE